MKKSHVETKRRICELRLGRQATDELQADQYGFTTRPDRPAIYVYCFRLRNAVNHHKSVDVIRVRR